MKETLPGAVQNSLLEALKARFDKNMARHAGLSWPEIQAKLKAAPDKMWSISEMERTGGEPDVIGRDEATGAFIFCDCSPESPGGRRSICFDREGLDSRREHKPADTAQDMAEAMGITILSEEEYRALQRLGSFDAKTSSWIETPADIRNLGGALFAEYRYGNVFVYHNGAGSYYAARGFRGLLHV